MAKCISVITEMLRLYNFAPYFSPFGAVSLCGVAGETFPSFSVSGPFLSDAVPCFQVPADSNLSTSTSVFF